MNNTKRITRTAIVILLASVGWLIALGDGTDIDTDIQPRAVASSCPLSMSFAVGGFTVPVRDAGAACARWRPNEHHLPREHRPGWPGQRRG